MKRKVSKRHVVASPRFVVFLSGLIK